MPSRVVVQPSGEYAIFSSVVDSFVAGRLTRAAAVEYWITRDPILGGPLSPLDAEAKVVRAEREPRRWQEAVDTIRAVRGEKYLQEMMAELGESSGP